MADASRELKIKLNFDASRIKAPKVPKVQVEIDDRSWRRLQDRIDNVRKQMRDVFGGSGPGSAPGGLRGSQTSWSGDFGSKSYWDRKVSSDRRLLDMTSLQNDKFVERAQSLQRSKILSASERWEAASAIHGMSPSIMNRMGMLQAAQFGRMNRVVGSPGWKMDIYNESMQRRELASDAKKDAAYEAQVSPSLSAFQRLVSVSAQARQTEAVGSQRHMKAIQDEIQARRDLTKKMDADRRVELAAMYGPALGAMAYVAEHLRESGFQNRARNAYVVGTGGILGAVAAASPETASTLAGSARLLAGELGMPFIRHAVQASSVIQRLSHWFRDLDDRTKSNAASMVVWGTALAGGAYGLSRLYTAGAGAVSVLGSIRDRVSSLTQFQPGMTVGQRAASVGTGIRSFFGDAGTVGGVGGAIASTIGYMNQDSPYSGMLTTAGNSAMIASMMTPQGAGWRAFGARFVPVAAGLAAASHLMRDRSIRDYSSSGRPSAYGTMAANDMRELLERRQGLGVNFMRAHFMHNMAQRHGVDLDASGLSPWGAGIWSGSPNSQSNIDLRERWLSNYAVAVTQANTPNPQGRRIPSSAVVGPYIDILRERRRRASPRSQEATQLDAQIRSLEANSQIGTLTAERDQLAYSLNFQPQHGSLESLKNQIQMEMIRDPMEQQRFEQQIRAIEELTRQIDQLNRGLNAGQGSPVLAP